MHSAPPYLRLGAPAPNSAQPSPKKDPQMSDRETSEKSRFQILRDNVMTGRGKFDPYRCKSGRAGWVGVGLFCFHQLVGLLADAGLLASAAAAALVKVGETRAAALAVLLEPATGKVTGFFRPCSSQAQCSNVQVATFYI